MSGIGDLLQDFMISESGRAVMVALASFLISRPLFWIGNTLKKLPPVVHQYIPQILTAATVVMVSIISLPIQTLVPQMNVTEMLLGALLGAGFAKFKHDNKKIKTLKANGG